MKNNPLGTSAYYFLFEFSPRPRTHRATNAKKTSENILMYGCSIMNVSLRTSKVSGNL